MTFFSKKYSDKGFTLIELLVVIAIIGVLASVVLASLNNARRKSRDARRVTDVKQIQLALELYFDGQGAGNYPTTLADLATYNYIPQVPTDPVPANGAYQYSYPSGNSRTTYHLGATLEEATNPALNGDRDCDSGPAATCPGGAHTGGFNGKGSGANGDDPTNPVYDLIP